MILIIRLTACLMSYLAVLFGSRNDVLFPDLCVYLARTDKKMEVDLILGVALNKSACEECSNIRLEE